MLSYKLKEKSPKKDFIFNMFGSTAMSFVSVLLLMVVSYIKGEEWAGIFSLCYTTAQMMYTLAVFEGRNIQITDTENKFTFPDIAMFRIITCIFMFAVSVGFVFFKGFNSTKITLCIMICAYMVLLALSDVFQGNLHLNGYLRIAGFSLGSQVILAAVGFTVALLITKNMFIAVSVMIVIVLLWILFFDLPYAQNFAPLKPRFEFAKQKHLFSLTAPLVVSVFLNQYNLNTPKYAIEKYLTEIDQSHYGYLVMPAFIINLMSLFAFRPQIVPLSEKWYNKDYKSFTKTVCILYGWIVIVTLTALGAGYFFGIPVLNILYRTNLNEYRNLLELLFIGGGFSAASTLTMVLLTVIKKQKYTIIAYGAAFAVALFAPNILVRQYGFTGAILSYLTVTVSLFVLLFIVFLVFVTREKRNN